MSGRLAGYTFKNNIKFKDWKESVQDSINSNFEASSLTARKQSAGLVQSKAFLHPDVWKALSSMSLTPFVEVEPDEDGKLISVLRVRLIFLLSQHLARMLADF